MQPESGTLCDLGSEDVVPATPKDEYFATIVIKSDLATGAKDLLADAMATKELKLTQFNQDDYTAPRKNAGYICEQEGKTLIFSYVNACDMPLGGIQQLHGQNFVISL